jgi:hypothetical protein
MNKWLELLLGLILVVGVILVGWYSAVNNWMILGTSLDFRNAAWVVLKGGIFWFVLMMGVLLILLGISDLKG